MSDIVERLRNWERVDILDAHEDGALYNAAADEIERLQKELSFAEYSGGGFERLADELRAENERLQKELDELKFRMEGLQK